MELRGFVKKLHYIYKNHNAGEICKQVGGNGHKSGDFPCFFPSASQGSDGYSQAEVDNYFPGYGNAGIHGHGGRGINMAFTKGRKRSSCFIWILVSRCCRNFTLGGEWDW
ncbi:hypothetical protein AABB24_038499 [Solanum stoloniferum]|uniref:Uncharacterized protein n=1 Tax=Solanum stoloniferum TaxID=62892 RepID=A0ABD2QXV9_9SOLN